MIFKFSYLVNHSEFLWYHGMIYMGFISNLNIIILKKWDILMNNYYGVQFYLAYRSNVFVKLYINSRNSFRPNKGREVMV